MNEGLTSNEVTIVLDSIKKSNMQQLKSLQDSIMKEISTRELEGNTQ